MQRIRQALLRLAAENAAVRPLVVPLTRQADKWQKLPEGWDQGSVEQFWESLTGANKHKVTKCISQMEGKVDDPGAFCASLADKVMGPEWRSKKAYTSQKVSVASLPALVKAAIAKTRVPAKRTLSVRIDSSYSMYSAGDDGARGFTFLVNLDTNRIDENWGAWGGGGLGTKPSPVDDTNHIKKLPLADNIIVVQGQEGGRDPYVGLTATAEGFARLVQPRGKVGRQVRRAYAVSDFLGGYTKLVDLVIKEIKGHITSHPFSKDPKPLATGFIYSLFQAFPSQRALADALWDLFERRTRVSLDPTWAQSLAYQVRSRIGVDAAGAMAAAAISLSLLIRTRQPRLADMAEVVFNKHLAREMEQAGAPGPVTAPKKPAEVFETTVTAEIKALAHGILQKIGTDPAAVETFAFLVAEDVNWHSIESVGQHDGVAEGVFNWELVSTVSGALGFGLEDVAAFIVAMFRQAGLARKAELVKKEALREFPDSYVDLGPVAKEGARSPFGGPGQPWDRALGEVSYALGVAMNSVPAYADKALSQEMFIKRGRAHLIGKFKESLKKKLGPRYDETLRAFAEYETHFADQIEAEGRLAAKRTELDTKYRDLREFFIHL